MKTKILNLMLAGILIMFLPGCNNEEAPVIKAPEVGNSSLKTTINFGESNNNFLKAAGSTAIPITSWNNISNMQLILYDATTGGTNNGVIRATTNIAPGDLTSTGQTWQYLWKDLPVGDYMLGIIANGAKTSDNVVRVDPTNTTNAEWSYNTLFNKDINTVFLQHRTTTAPAGTGLGEWYLPPAEIFTAYSQVFTLTDGQTTPVGALTLTRDVSMMRVRLNTNDYDTIVDFNHANSYLRVQRLPAQLSISNTGGRVANNVLKTAKIQAGSGTGTFETSDPPAAGYSTPTGTGTPTIIDNNFTLWKDIIIFPNMPRGSYVQGSEPAVNTQERYGLVISGVVQAGKTYVDAAGNTIAPGANVYWYAIVNAGFFNNMIREVNVTLNTNGTGIEPDELEFGDLQIELNTPLPWDSAILDVDVSM